MQLSRNFSLLEMTKSQTALRHALPNIPGSEEIENLKNLCEFVLEPIRTNFRKPVNISSGYRSPEVNILVGGSKTSDHRRGEAADIEISGVSNYELACWIRDNLVYKQLILEFYTPGQPSSGWVHVSYSKNNNEKKTMTAIKEQGRTVYKVGLIL